MNRQHSRNDALMSVITQFCVVVILGLLVWGFLGRQAGGSFAVGGLICVVPNIYLYSRVFAHFGARQAKNIIKAFYWGEAVKLILTGCGFAGAFILIPWIKPPWLFSGYIAAQLGFWLAPIVLGFLLGKTAR